MSAPFATHQDVQARWRTLVSDEQDIADQLAADASDIIRIRWPNVDDRVTAGELQAESIVRVVAAMVKRAMIRPVPEGFESFTQAAGPLSAGGKVANPNGNLYLSAEEVRLFEGPRTRRAFGVDLSPNVAPCWPY
jgi:hypothetical protein